MTIVVSFQVRPTQVDVQRGREGKSSWEQIGEDRKEQETSFSMDRHFCGEKASSHPDACEINSLERKN